MGRGFNRDINASRSQGLQPLKFLEFGRIQPKRPVRRTPLKDSWLFHQTSLNRIRPNIVPAPEIFSTIPDPPIMKSRLPYRPLEMQFLTDPSRRSALNHLHGFFQACCFSGCEQNMQMVRHQYKLMEFTKSAIPAVHQLLNHDISHSLPAKKFSALPGMSGYKVDASLVNPAHDAAHVDLQGLKPALLRSATVAVKTATHKATAITTPMISY